MIGKSQSESCGINGQRPTFLPSRNGLANTASRLLGPDSPNPIWSCQGKSRLLERFQVSDILWEDASHDLGHARPRPLGCGYGLLDHLGSDPAATGLRGQEQSKFSDVAEGPRKLELHVTQMPLADHHGES